MNSQSCVNIEKEWDIVSARQLGRNLARKLGFGTVDQARIATAISELARNIYLYAGSGEIYFDIVEDHPKKGIRIRAIDQGQGIEDIGKVMKDGYSTSGGLGAGLPGVKRLMDEFHISSVPGAGTEVEVVKWLR
ncbi:serine/threonine-protein kinase RsbT [Melghiribacillus thermohalophilus]|uniref:Serine/threonine-protein kinase RsbT n=1 Tax=Melghiribacillus thermohalophilus TaxID=1324956 RepID=A0A4R3N188_9BACI|nr:anti-sigma regulatory factor [Melghiribacillus thermohalophilus]TCT20389.1 serine/threonine-protein kinase RsbT [Melghiribacillus thermohalophilus]